MDLATSNPTVHVVHRVVLPVDVHGEITSAPLDRFDSPFSAGAVVVVDCGAGVWMRSDEIRRVADALRHVEKVTITGTCLDPVEQYHGTVAVGVAAIGKELVRFLAAHSSPVAA